MTTPADVLNQVVPPLVRLASRPGALLLQIAGLVVGGFAILGLVHGLRGEAAGAWVPLALALILSVPVVLLAVRRHHLHVRTQGLGPVQTLSTDVVITDAEPPQPLSPEDQEKVAAALAESRIRTARFMPRVEAVQRAAVAAAGGVTHAPYLRDDLRVTILALVGTMAAVPLATLGSIITAIVLLTA